MKAVKEFYISGSNGTVFMISMSDGSTLFADSVNDANADFKSLHFISNQDNPAEAREPFYGDFSLKQLVEYVGA